ncbi:MAG: proteasome subunit alpha [Actinomycetota bacterium]|nr:proteasome subunit alpha [Actinomycetota bacterium]
MSMPFYVSPEQLMKDKADYARKGIARGRSVVVLAYDKGIAFVAENPQSLRKISEIYDRIAFAAVGMYYEFENLRVAGIRYADLRGYSYDRSDVSARGLANAYAQTLGTVFTQEPKPYEIELVVAEVGQDPDHDQIFRLTYDGSVADQHGFVVMGGASVQAEAALRERWREGLDLSQALRLAVDTLAADPNGGEARALTGPQLEVAVLDRLRPRRTFRRIAGPLLDDLLSADSAVSDAPLTDDARPGHHDVLTGRVPETPGTDQPPRADADPLPPLPSPPPLPPNDEEHQQ